MPGFGVDAFVLTQITTDYFTELHRLQHKNINLCNLIF
jgi:hypothetical protein